MMDDRLGIVIPTLNEARHLPLLLDDLARLGSACDIVVSDGGSWDGTPSLAEAGGARLVRVSRGRARQMNAGAAALATRWLLFLHADSRISPDAGPVLARWLTEAEGRRGSVAAHFGFRLDGDGWFWRFLEWGQGLRERYTGLAYGDQGLLVSRSDFLAVGGFPEIPLMEDVEMIRRLRRRGSVDRLPAMLLTSTRRYEREGRWRAFLRNAALILLYTLRVPPDRLSRWYDPLPDGGGDPGAAQAPMSEEQEAGGRSRLLMVFAKAPVAGKVKTRLAADIGEDAAVRIYRKMGGGIIDRVRRGRHRTVILFDPPEALAQMRDWLGEDVEFRPQGEGDLGDRLKAAFAKGFHSADAVCVVGTDVPGLTLERIENAFDGLERGDIVLGPAEDGGYYLLGLNRPAPSLFDGIGWGGGTVLEETRERARRLGLLEVMLESLRDIDTVADLRATPHLLEEVRKR